MKYSITFPILLNQSNYSVEKLDEIIHQISSPTWVDISTVIIACLGVIISGIAIYYAIQVPKKIADRQDKIALFDKRHDVYRAYCSLHNKTETLYSHENPLCQNDLYTRLGSWTAVISILFPDENLMDIVKQPQNVDDNKAIIEALITVQEIVELNTSMLNEATFLFDLSPDEIATITDIIEKIKNLRLQFIEKDSDAIKEFIKDLYRSIQNSTILTTMENHLKLYERS